MADVEKDRLLAKRICLEIRKGNLEAITELFDLYDNYLKTFARKKMKDDRNVEDIVQNLWIEFLNGRAICSYEGENNSSLRTYLTKILIYRVINELKKSDNYNKKHIELPVRSQLEGILSQIYTQPSPEQIFLSKEQKAIVREILEELKKISPKDEKYLTERFINGKTYEEIAKNEINESEEDETEIKKITDRIKKQITRSKSGSLAKFRILIERKLEKN